jgi:hypothetical protein
MKKSANSTKLSFLKMIAVSLLLPTLVQAAYILPTGSFWQGGRNYNKDGVQAFVESAVYDTSSTAYLNVANKITNPGTGQYLYAYQVFNIGAELMPVTAFELLGGNPAKASGIGSARDGTGTDIVPTNNGTSFVWKFENGVFVVDKHSAFMVFSTDKGPVAGTFKLSTLTDYGDEPPVDNGNDVPEPTTMAMLAAGAIGLLRKVRKS